MYRALTKTRNAKPATISVKVLRGRFPSPLKSKAAACPGDAVVSRTVRPADATPIGLPRYARADPPDIVDWPFLVIWPPAKHQQQPVPALRLHVLNFTLITDQASAPSSKRITPPPSPNPVYNNDLAKSQAEHEDNAQFLRYAPGLASSI